VRGNSLPIDNDLGDHHDFKGDPEDAVDDEWPVLVDYRVEQPHDRADQKSAPHDDGHIVRALVYPYLHHLRDGGQGYDDGEHVNQVIDEPHPFVGMGIRVKFFCLPLSLMHMVQSMMAYGHFSGHLESCSA